MADGNATKKYTSKIGNRRGSCRVFVDGRELHDVETIGFAYGFNSRRAINLSRSIMCDYFEDPNVPKELWMDFYWDVISVYPPELEWEITGDMISQWIYRKFQSFDEDETNLKDEKEEPKVIETFEPEPRYHPVPIKETEKQPEENEKESVVLVDDEEDEEIEDDEIDYDDFEGDEEREEIHEL